MTRQTDLMENIEKKVKGQYVQLVQSEINEEIRNNLRKDFIGTKIESADMGSSFATVIISEDKKLRYIGTHIKTDSSRALEISCVDMDSAHLTRSDRLDYLKKMPSGAYKKLITNSYDIAQKLGYNAVTVKTTEKKEIDILKELGYKFNDNIAMKKVE